MKKLFLLTLLPVLVLTANAQINDCWCIPFPKGDYINRDSLVVDTCGLSSELTYEDCDALFFQPGNSGYVREMRRIYARKYWIVQFDVQAIQLDSAPVNTIIKFGWEKIDSGYSEIRKKFEELEEKYGNFILIKHYPEIISGPWSQQFFVEFDNYINVADFQDSTNIPSTTFSLYSPPAYPTSVEENFSLCSETKIFPQPVNANSLLTIELPSNKISSVEIFSFLGEKISSVDAPPHREKFLRVQFPSLTSGAYFLKISGKNFSLMKPIIVAE